MDVVGVLLCARAAGRAGTVTPMLGHRFANTGATVGISSGGRGGGYSGSRYKGAGGSGSAGVQDAQRVIGGNAHSIAHARYVAKEAPGVARQAARAYERNARALNRATAPLTVNPLILGTGVCLGLGLHSMICSTLLSWYPMIKDSSAFLSERGF